MPIARFNFVGGDTYLAKIELLKIQGESPVEWEYIDVQGTSIAEMSSKLFCGSLFDMNRGYILYNIGANKEIIQYADNILQTNNSNYYVFWDSDANIFSKTNIFNKKWLKTIEYLEKKGRVVTYPHSLLLKDPKSISYVIAEFKKINKNINSENAKLFIKMNNENVAYVCTEIKKLSFIEEREITIKEIEKYCFDNSSEPALYELTNEINRFNVIESYSLCLELIKKNMHPNVILDVLLKRQRWLTIIASLIKSGKDYNYIKNYIYNFGKYSNLKEDKDFREQLFKDGFSNKADCFDDYVVKPENFSWSFMSDALISYVQELERKNNLDKNIFPNRLIKRVTKDYSMLCANSQKIRISQHHDSLLFSCISGCCSHKL